MTKPGAVPEPLLQFFKAISMEGGVPPREFFFEFELNRVQFSFYGTLKYGVCYLPFKMLNLTEMSSRSDQK